MKRSRYDGYGIVPADRRKMRALPLWKEVELSRYDTMRGYCEALKAARCLLSPGVEQILLRNMTADEIMMRDLYRGRSTTMWFKIRLVRIRLMDMGFPTWALYQDIAEVVKRRWQLGPCLVETVPALRLSYTDQAKGECLYIATALGCEKILSIENDGGSDYIGERRTDYPFQFDPADEFVFRQE